MPPNYVIKTMTREDLNLAIDWAAAEGWNPGLQDANCFYAADPQGFLMGFLDEEPISSISVVAYGTMFGFLGFYIVKPEFRGQGYGLQIWRAGLASLKQRIIGLDGVVAQQDNYLKSGFKLAYRNIRYQGMGDGDTQLPGASRLVPLSSLPFAVVSKYDQLCFPEDRSTFLQGWLTQPDSHGLGLIQDQDLVGYGVLRGCREGYKIGPLFADTPQFAEEIYLALKTHVSFGSPFYLDVPEVNAPAVALAERYGMKSIFETARMYTPAEPELSKERIFGVTTFELG